eukprot:5054478-Prymnesium_polylepis.1
MLERARLLSDRYYDGHKTVPPKAPHSTVSQLHPYRAQLWACAICVIRATWHDYTNGTKRRYSRARLSE